MSVKICFAVLTCMLFIQSANASTGYKSSIQTNFVKGGESREEVNTPRLKKLAKVTAEQAKKIALGRFKGVVKQIDLENEDGNLIWSVEVGKHELAIDAGNGKILAIE